MPKSLFPALLFCMVSVGCSSDDSAEKSDEGAAGAQAETELAWEDRGWKQKSAYMKEVVKPEMAKMLSGHDAERFDDVTCKTCHGKDPKAVKFELPSAELPPLDPTDSFAAHREEEPALTEFMMKKFTPKMVELLGVEPWSPENPKGFGCFSCHTMKQAEPRAAAAEGSEEGGPVEAGESSMDDSAMDDGAMDDGNATE